MVSLVATILARRAAQTIAEVKAATALHHRASKGALFYTYHVQVVYDMVYADGAVGRFVRIVGHFDRLALAKITQGVHIDIARSTQRSGAGDNLQVV